MIRSDFLCRKGLRFVASRCYSHQIGRVPWEVSVMPIPVKLSEIVDEMSMSGD